MTIDELIAMLEMQEEILQFSHFTNEDAWELGSILTSEARRRQLPVAVTIRLNNGYTVFRYAADGTNCHDDDWTEPEVPLCAKIGTQHLTYLYGSEKRRKDPGRLVFRPQGVCSLRRRLPD